MKISVRWLAVSALALTAASPASALLISGTEVGGIDTIVGASSSLFVGGVCEAPGSNPSNEACWGEQVSGGELTYLNKASDVSVMYSADRTLAAFALLGDPAQYIVKNAQAWVLLDNVSATGWGVLDLTSPLLQGLKLNLGKADQLTISHVTAFNASVPEPGALTLVALGVAGLFGVRRRLAA